jgi:gliding motility-associated-like protein
MATLVKLKNLFILACLTFLCQVGNLYAQNLVPDPGFEIFDPEKLVCDWDHPEGDVGISKGILTHWWQPTASTSDLWSLKNPFYCGQHPSNGKQKPYDGNNFIGLQPFSKFTGEETNYREYVSTKLKEPLVPGRTYLIKMHVSLPDIAGLASNNIGALLTTKAINRPEYIGRLVATPQLVETEIITDTTAWQVVSTCFVADSAYQYLTLGNFSAAGETRIQEVIADYSGNRVKDCYYFIDYVTVEETVPPPQEVDLPGDTLLCVGEQFTLDVSQEGATYRWQDGSTSPQYTVSKPGYYSVEVSRGLCYTTSDSFFFGFWPRVDLGADTLICDAGELVLDAKHPAGNYRWNTGERSPQITVRQSGLYWVKVRTPTCSFSDSIRVELVRCPGKVPNVFTPNGDGINDTFFVEGIEYGSWDIEIFNRWGQRVYTQAAYRNQWAAKGLASGIYYYKLNDKMTGKSLQGWVKVLR